eukprot:93846_1
MNNIVLYLLLGFIYDLVYGGTCNADECINENVLYYDSIAEYIYPHHSTYEDHKTGHDITYHKINSIKPESVVTHVFDKVQPIPRSQLNNFREPLKAILKRDLHFDKLPSELANKIDMQTDLASFLNKGQEYYIRVDLSGDYGGKSELGYGVFAFLVDPNDAENIIFGATAIREEWKENENIKILKDKWDVKDVEKYVIHELYQRIHPKVSEKVQARITNGDNPYKAAQFDEFTSSSCRDHMTHVIFISDKSGSMGATDIVPIGAEYDFIKHKGLDNRLGALFSAIHDFIQIRTQHKCNDIITSILFDSFAEKVEKNIKISETFVQDYLLQNKAGGGTNFGNAFMKANELINYNEQTTVIFLTDGEASDGGASGYVKNWFANMTDKLKLFCMVIGNGDRPVVNNICKSGNGEVRKALNGKDLIDGYKEFATYKMDRNQ